MQFGPVEIINYAHGITSDKFRRRKHCCSFSSIVILCYIKDYSIRTYPCTEALRTKIQGGSNMTGTDLYVKKPHCAAVVRP